MGAQGSNNRHAESSEAYGYYESGDVSTHSINTAEFTVGIVVENETTYYTFKDSNNQYLYAAATSNNYLRSSSTLTDSAKWQIVVGDSNASITTYADYDDESHTKYMGGSGSAFGCYQSAINPIAIFIDVENNVDLFVSNYMHTDISYDSDPDLPINNTGNCDSQGWYLSAKRALVGMGSDYISEFQDNSKYANALARYNAWATACKDTSPFAGNDIVLAQNAGSIFDNIGESNNATAIIVIISLVSVTAIGGYFFLRKKKER